ncbi:MAG TPA: hypothetical protein VL263_12550 [Vicinamibacterales bacterium]|nr:hypothetical protein [Vicinamibacterales bacterium]
MSRPSLTLATAIAAAVVGSLALIGGLALWPALALAARPREQAATSIVLVVSGMVNVTASRGIRHGRARALLASGIFTSVFIVYSALVIHDTGEFFWLHAAYLVALLAVHRRGHATI